MNFGNLPNMVDQGVEFSFFTINHVKNVKGWYFHFHMTHVDQILIESKSAGVD